MSLLFCTEHGCAVLRRDVPSLYAHWMLMLIVVAVGDDFYSSRKPGGMCPGEVATWILKRDCERANGPVSCFVPCVDTGKVLKSRCTKAGNHRKMPWLRWVADVKMWKYLSSIHNIMSSVCTVRGSSWVEWIWLLGIMWSRLTTSVTICYWIVVMNTE